MQRFLTNAIWQIFTYITSKRFTLYKNLKNKDLASKSSKPTIPSQNFFNVIFFLNFKKFLELFVHGNFIIL